LTEGEIRAVVTETAMEVFELEPDEVEGNPSFQRDLDVDSLQKLEFIATLEQHFGIRYTSSEGSSMDSLDDAVRFTQARL
jgi:acyl carrier protein